MRKRKTIRKTLSCLTACCIAAAVCMPASAALDAEFGQTLAKHILGKTAMELDSYLSADLNLDNNVNIVDMSLLKRQLVSGEIIEVPKAEIHLKDNGTTVSGENAAVSADGNIVTITASGEYLIDGSLTDGRIIVNVPDEVADPGTVKLFFDGVTIGCSTDAPVYIINAENTSINLVKDTVSTITDGTTYSETEAAIFAKDDLTIKGSGTLNVSAETQYGIHCNNDLKINCDGGTVNVETVTADAIRGKTSVTVKAGTVNVNSEGDGIKSTKGDVLIEGGTVSIKAGNDAVQAETTLDITGGNIIACGDRGLTGVGKVNLSGGKVLVTATDLQCETLSENANAILLNFSAEYLKSSVISLSDDKAEVFSAAATKKFSYAIVYSPELTAKSYSVYLDKQQLCYGADASTAFAPGSATVYEFVVPK